MLGHSYQLLAADPDLAVLVKGAPGEGSGQVTKMVARMMPGTANTTCSP